MPGSFGQTHAQTTLEGLLDGWGAVGLDSLKSLISKIRVALTHAGLPGTELIRNAFGAYQFRLHATDGSTWTPPR